MNLKNLNLLKRYSIKELKIDKEMCCTDNLQAELARLVVNDKLKEIRFWEINMIEKCYKKR